LHNVAHHFLRTNGRQGTLVNISSLAAAISMPGISSKAVSKLAALKLAEALHLGKSFGSHPSR